MSYIYVHIYLWMCVRVCPYVCANVRVSYYNPITFFYLEHNHIQIDVYGCTYTKKQIYLVRFAGKRTPIIPDGEKTTLKWLNCYICFKKIL